MPDLVAACDDPGAWEGQTVAGGVTLPAAQMGVVALDELVVHGWDLGARHRPALPRHPAEAEAVLAFTTAVAVALAYGLSERECQVTRLCMRGLPTK